MANYELIGLNEATPQLLAPTSGDSASLAGNLGIGTSSPSAKLHVYDATAPQATFDNGTSTFIVGNNVGGNNKILYGTGAYPMIFYTNATEVMRLDSAGNLGIGVTPSVFTSTIRALQVGSTSVFRAGDSVYTQATYVESNARQEAVTDYYIANGFATRYGQQGGAHQWYTAPSGTAGAAITFTEKARIDSDGLKFNGDTAAANGLDDYEEGTWTPTVAFGGASVGITYSSQVGTYTKIGRLVTCNCVLTLTAKGSSTGQASVSLPIAARSGNEGVASGAIHLLNNVTFANVPIVRTSTTAAYFGEMLEAGTPGTDLNDTDFANNSAVGLTISYETA